MSAPVPVGDSEDESIIENVQQLPIQLDAGIENVGAVIANTEGMLD